MNPLNVGGTGSFKVETKINGYSIDSNYNFGSIGVSKSPGILYNAVFMFVNGSSNLAGQASNYLMEMISTDDLPANIVF